MIWVVNGCYRQLSEAPLLLEAVATGEGDGYGPDRHPLGVATGFGEVRAASGSGCGGGAVVALALAIFITFMKNQQSKVRRLP